jgi:hypothetical protein
VLHGVVPEDDGRTKEIEVNQEANVGEEQNQEVVPEHDG